MLNFKFQVWSEYLRVSLPAAAIKERTYTLNGAVRETIYRTRSTHVRRHAFAQLKIPHCCLHLTHNTTIGTNRSTMRSPVQFSGAQQRRQCSMAQRRTTPLWRFTVIVALLSLAVVAVSSFTVRKHFLRPSRLLLAHETRRSTDDVEKADVWDQDEVYENGAQPHRQEELWLVVHDEDDEVVIGDVHNLKVPQIHLPPRLVPGVAWQHHHQATKRLIHGDPDSGEGGVSSLITELFPRSKLVSASPEWKQLGQESEAMKKTHLRDLLKDDVRCDGMYAQWDGVYLDYSRQRASLNTLKLLLDLADRQGLKGKIEAMFNGEKINFTEERAVLHTALRADRELEGTVLVDGVDAIKEVHEVLDQVKHFTEGVRSGEIRGYTGRRLRNIVSVGIGGSYLGPEFLHEVLKTEPEGINSALGYSLRFLANVDPVDVERTCADLDPEETLIVIVSKTFTTAETMLNARTMRQWLWDFMGDDKEVVRKHFVACASVTATDKVEAFGIDTERYFFRFWDWVGGRYSVCSAAGAVPVSLVYGFELFEKFLKGANSIDKHFRETPLDKNIPVIMGLLGVWNMSFMGYNTRTTLPYAEALLKLPSHIQQLDMESNGKCMTKFGVEVDYPVGEIDFGEPGTNGQHSFFQLLHMGQTAACDFIGFAQSQHDLCLDDESLSSHDELMANFFAQPDALATGKTAEELRAEGVKEELIPHRTFKGNRPSMLLLLPKLTAYSAGQLLAIYEHRTAVQGFIWDINSFDQYGVELGKKLAVDVKDHLLKARKTQDGHKVETSSPATSRILNYYIENSTGCPERLNGNPTTRITRKTHREHYPPTGHDLGRHGGRLS